MCPDRPLWTKPVLPRAIKQSIGRSVSRAVDASTPGTKWRDVGSQGIGFRVRVTRVRVKRVWMNQMKRLKILPPTLPLLWARKLAVALKERF